MTRILLFFEWSQIKAQSQNFSDTVFRTILCSEQMEHQKLKICLSKHSGFVELLLRSCRVLKLDYETINGVLIIDNHDERWMKTVQNGDLVKEMFSQFVKYFPNSKVSLRKLSIKFDCSNENKDVFLNLLDQLTSPQKVAVKYVMLRGVTKQSDVISVHLKGSCSVIDSQQALWN